MRKCFISTLYRLIKLSFRKRHIMNNLKIQINLGIFVKKNTSECYYKILNTFHSLI